MENVFVLENVKEESCIGENVEIKEEPIPDWREVPTVKVEPPNQEKQHEILTIPRSSLFENFVEEDLFALNSIVKEENCVAEVIKIKDEPSMDWCETHNVVKVESSNQAKENDTLSQCSTTGNIISGRNDEPLQQFSSYKATLAHIRDGDAPETSVAGFRHKDLDYAALALVVIGVIRRRRRRRDRRYWVHPVNSCRLLKGQFHTLFGDLKEKPEKFFSYFRMSERTFNELLSAIKEDLTGQETNMRAPVSPEEKLAVALRYLACGCSFSELHRSYRLGISTISKIVWQVCQAIWTNLQATCLPNPSEEKWLEIAEGFQRAANFPNCVGAIAGKHIRIRKPSEGASPFHNYPKFYSILLLAICDSNYCFTCIDVGAYGQSNDAGAFKNSTLNTKLETNALKIPEPKPLDPNSFKGSLPHVFIGDEGFGLSKRVLRPFAGSCLTLKKKVFNFRLTRARRYVECAFAILSNKWHIFHKPFNVAEDRSMDIVKACCVLHNLVRTRDGYDFEDTLSVEGFEAMAKDGSSGGRSANDIRDRFADYFLSPHGQISWQYNKIERQCH